MSVKSLQKKMLLFLYLYLFNTAVRRFNNELILCTTRNKREKKKEKKGSGPVWLKTFNFPPLLFCEGSHTGTDGLSMHNHIMWQRKQWQRKTRFVTLCCTDMIFSLMSWHLDFMFLCITAAKVIFYQVRNLLVLFNPFMGSSTDASTQKSWENCTADIRLPSPLWFK